MDESHDFICDFCGKTSTRTRNNFLRDLRLKRKKYCSKECGYKAKSTQQLSNCCQCDKEFYIRKSEYLKSDNHFCSRSCAATYNNIISAKPYYCIFCNQKCERNRKFCSKQCRHNLIYKQYADYINEHNCPPEGNDGYINLGKIKEYLKTKNGDKCSICGLEKWNNKKLLKILDHIDGNSSNWNIRNLRLVCSNCDSQLDTYKGKNKGNGRFIRRKRYANRQSY